MKYLILASLLLPVSSFALSLLSRDERYLGGKEQVIKKEAVSNESDKALVNKLLNELERSNKKIERLSQRKTKRAKQKTLPENKIIMIGKANEIRMLDEFDGIITDSVLAVTGVMSRIKVHLNKTEVIPAKSFLRCAGTPLGYRVKAKCDRLITPKQTYKVDVVLKDVFDGVDTLFSSEVYSGEEEAFLKESFASFLGAAFDVSKARLQTPWGEVEQNTAKNKILSGLVGATSTITDKIRDDASKIKTVCILNAGKKVIALFDEGVSL